MNARASALADAGQVTDAYARFTDRLSARLRANLAASTGLFTTDAGDLWPLYLRSWKNTTQRQCHNCHACRRFIQRFGSLATIDKLGQVIPALWHEDDAPPEYRSAVHALRRAVAGAKITGVHYTPDQGWGEPFAGGWQHLCATIPLDFVHMVPTEDPHQASARKSQGFENVSRFLRSHPFDVIETAVQLLRTDKAYRGEKVLGVAEWLHELEESRRALPPRLRDNWTWRQVAAAPEGFLHPSSSMIGTLLDDLLTQPVDTALAKFRKKMDPHVYQRPSAPPAAGAIEQAEKLFAQMDAGRALRRRFALVHEVQALWRRPADKLPHPGALFSHLRETTARPIITTGPARITWAKFERDVLPGATRIRLRVPSSGAFSTLVTASDPDAPPLLQWDSPSDRNPFSWYFWNKPAATAMQFGLQSGSLVDVVAVSHLPHQWTSHPTHIPPGTLLMLEGARDTKDPGLCLFPEWLRSEFHPVRSVLEAHSRTAKLELVFGPVAAGLVLQEMPGDWGAIVHVTTGRLESVYHIDRWE